MQPQVVLGADVGDGVELVDGADVGRAEVGDDGEQPVDVTTRRAPPAARRRSSGRARRAARARRRRPSPGPRRGPRRGSRRSWRSASGRRAGRRARRRAWWRAVTSADRLAAEPPLTKQPPAPSGKPARLGQPLQRLVLGGDGAGAALPQPAEDARRADDEVEHVGRRRRRGGHVGEVQRRVHRPAGVHQHVAEQRQGLVAADALGADHAVEDARPAGRPGGRPTSGPSTSSAARWRSR